MQSTDNISINEDFLSSQSQCTKIDAQIDSNLEQIVLIATDDAVSPQLLDNASLVAPIVPQTNATLQEFDCKLRNNYPIFPNCPRNLFKKEFAFDTAEKKTFNRVALADLFEFPEDLIDNKDDYIQFVTFTANWDSFEDQKEEEESDKKSETSSDEIVTTEAPVEASPGTSTPVHSSDSISDSDSSRLTLCVS